MTWILLLCMMVLGSAPAWAATYYVATTACNDGNAGTLAQPRCTIAAGMQLLTPGDTLMIRGGTYAKISWQTHAIPSGTSWSSPITIQNYNNETVTLPGLDISAYSSTVYRYLILSGFLFEGGGTQQVGVFIGGPNAHHIRVRQSEVRNFSQQGVQSFGSADLEFVGLTVHHNGTDRLKHGFYVAVTRGLIAYCNIYSNSGYGIQVYDSFLPTSATDMVLHNNWVHDNLGDSGVTLNHGTNIFFYNNLVTNNIGGGINPITRGARQTKVFNNTVYGNSGYGIVVESDGTDTSIRNNIVSQNVIPATGIDSPFRDLAPAGSPTIFSHNLCSVAWTGCALTATAAQTFVNAGGNNYHLLSTSAARDGGTPLLMVPDGFDDTMGSGFVARPWPVAELGGAYDIGAYEFVGTSDPPVVAITTPTSAASFASPTASLATVAGTAHDPQGDGTITGVTWACPQCTPASGSASYNSTTGAWSFGPVTLASGSNVVTVTASDGTLTGQDTLTATYAAPAGCTHYASPSGGGDGSSEGSPMTLAQFVAQADPGEVLCLADGVYSPYTFPESFAGANGNPITIRALHDGQVLFRGSDALRTQGSWGVLEGVNVEGTGAGRTFSFGGDHWIVRRLIAWSTYASGGTAINAWATNSLLEDCAAFGVARKVFEIGSSATITNTTIRRCWVRYEAILPCENCSPRNAIEIGYFQSYVTAENILATRMHAPDDPAGGSAEGAILMAHGHHNRLLGSIGYGGATPSFDGGAYIIGSYSDSQYGDPLHDTLLQDVLAILSPSNSSFAGTRPFNLNQAPGGYSNTLTNVVGVAGVPSTCDWGATCTQIRQGTSLGNALGSGASVWTEIPGICRRYVDGVLTGVPLWPWPMNQRIVDAMALSGEGRTPVDVTAAVEALLGPIPAQCWGDAVEPPPLVLAAPSNLQVTTFNNIVPKSVEVAWQYTQGSEPAVGFRLWEQLNCTGAWTQVGSDLPVTPLTATRTNLPLAPSYCWAVTAINGSGTNSADSNIATYTVPPDPPAPLPGTAGGGPSLLLPVDLGTLATPRILETQPVKPGTRALVGLREWWRVVPWLTGGTRWYGLLGRHPLQEVTLTTSPWATLTRPGGHGSLHFAGNGYYTTGAGYAENGPFTLSAWLRTDTDTGYMELGGQVDTLGGATWINGWGIWRSSDGTTINCTKADDGSETGLSAAHTPQRWTHVACSWDGATLRFFVDGALQGSAVTLPAYPTGLSFTVGGVPGAPTSRWQGHVDSVMLFRTALSDAQVLDVYRAGRTSEQDLLQYWTFLPQDGPPQQRGVKGGYFFRR